MAELGDEREKSLAIHKAAWRLVPFLAILYFVSFLDRVNVGFAALTMNADIGLSASAFGSGAGIFFIGYILFTVPANIMLQRIGAARWMAVLTIFWGVVSLCNGFVHTPTQFYLLRFLLGAAESGFFPGVILYLSFWFPSDVRGRITGNFFAAVPLSNVFGAPLSGWLLDRSALGLKGWQTMFLLEALPAIVLGVVALFWLTNTPAEAGWLSPHQRATLQAAVSADRVEHGHERVRDGLLIPLMWGVGFLYFLLVVGLYGFGFWVPQILGAVGHLSHQEIGWATAVPYGAAVMCMFLWARNSDATQERYWHIALPSLVGAIGFFSAGHAATTATVLVGFSLAAVGIYAACPIVWTLPASVANGPALASGIALVNSVGNMAGYVGPMMMGWLRDRTGDYVAGIYVMTTSMIAASVLALALKACKHGAPLSKLSNHTNTAI